AVHEAAGEAVRRARGGGGPVILECRTYRTRPHAEGMGDFTYRTREEVEEWKTRCPIQQLRQRLQDEEYATEAELDEVAEVIDGVVGEAHQFAEKSAWPDTTTATAHVYAEPRAAAPQPPAAADTAREITCMQATLEALSGEMDRNPRIFVMGEGVGKRGG